MREDFRSIFRYQNCVFPLCGRLTIFCANCPAVIFVFPYVWFSHIYHWFNRKCHSRHKKNAFIWFTDMIDPWFFMELYTTSMSSDFSYNAVSILYSMFITNLPHISHRSPRLCCLKRKIDTFFCYTNKLFLFFRNLTDAEHS